MQRPQCLLDDAVVRPGAGPGGVLRRGKAEEQEAADAQLREPLGLDDQLVDRVAHVRREGRDRFAHAQARA